MKRFRTPITAAMRHRFDHHDWPGNVRELRHLAERATLGLFDEPVADVPPAPEPMGRVTLPSLVERFEAEQIRQALARFEGDVRATLEVLGIPRKTFYDKLARHGIDRAADATGP